MDSIFVRKATSNDHQTLLRFEQGVIATERPFDETLADDPIKYYDLHELLTAPHIHLVVAEFENEVVACGYARIEESKAFLRHRRHSYLGFMYTDPNFRGRGINNLILDALKKWSAFQGVLELRLEVYSGNLSARRAYEKSGFMPHIIEMRMSI